MNIVAIVAVSLIVIFALLCRLAFLNDQRCAVEFRLDAAESRLATTKDQLAESRDNVREQNAKIARLERYKSRVEAAIGGLEWDE